MNVLELADELRTDCYTLVAFAAPGDIPAGWNGNTEIPADVVQVIRDAWNSTGEDGMPIKR